MNSMLLASNSVWNYVLIGVVALLLIAMPIMMSQRNKKESQKIQENREDVIELLYLLSKIEKNHHRNQQFSTKI